MSTAMATARAAAAAAAYATYMSQTHHYIPPLSMGLPSTAPAIYAAPGGSMYAMAPPTSYAPMVQPMLSAAPAITYSTAAVPSAAASSSSLSMQLQVHAPPSAMMTGGVDLPGSGTAFAIPSAPSAFRMTVPTTSAPIDAALAASSALRSMQIRPSTLLRAVASPRDGGIPHHDAWRATVHEHGPPPAWRPPASLSSYAGHAFASPADASIPSSAAPVLSVLGQVAEHMARSDGFPTTGPGMRAGKRPRDAATDAPQSASKDLDRGLHHH